jgi:hypothetical protein
MIFLQYKNKKSAILSKKLLIYYNLLKKSVISLKNYDFITIYLQYMKKVQFYYFIINLLEKV